MIDLQWIAQIATERAIDSIPLGLLIVALAWLALRAFGRQSSRTRFTVWFAALLAIAALPFIPTLGEAASAMRGPRAQLTVSTVWARAIFIGWIAIAATAIVRVALGIAQLRRLRKNCTPIPLSDLPLALQPVVMQFQAIRSVAICSSVDVRVPTAIGFLKPVVLLPKWALAELPAEDLKAILLHEVAHLRRGDDWTNLAQKLLRTLFFFHPGVWWIERRLVLEREMACDEMVLAETGNRRAYAECLVSLAEKSFMRRGLAMAQAAISHARETSLRLARILHPEPVAPKVFKPALAAVAGLGLVCLAVLPGLPKLIAFQDAVPQPALFAARAASSPAGVQASLHGGNSTVPAGPGMPMAARARSEKSAQIMTVKGRAAHPRLAVLRARAWRVAPDPQLLVIVQSSEYDGLGPAKLSFCVWRVMFTDGNRNTVRAEVIAKSL